MKYDILSAALKDAVEPVLDELYENEEISDTPLVSEEFNGRIQEIINKKNKTIHIPLSFKRAACLAITFVIVLVCCIGVDVDVDAFKEKNFEFLPIVTPDALMIFTYGENDAKYASSGGMDDVYIQKYELSGIDDEYELVVDFEDQTSYDISYIDEKGKVIISFDQNHYYDFSGIKLPLETSKKTWIKHNGREYYVEIYDGEYGYCVTLIWGIGDTAICLSTWDISYDETMRLAETIREKS